MPALIHALHHSHCETGDLACIAGSPRRQQRSLVTSRHGPGRVGSLGRRARAHPAVPAPSSLGAQSTSMKHAPPSRPPTTAVYRLMAGVLRKRFCARGAAGRSSAPARALCLVRAWSSTLTKATKQPGVYLGAPSGARLAWCVE